MTGLIQMQAALLLGTPLGRLFAGVVTLLIIASLIGGVLAWRSRGKPSATIINLNQRIVAWWWMVGVLALCFWLGAGAQSNTDEGPDTAPPSSDLATARHLGRRVAMTTLQFVHGRRSLLVEA